MKLAVAGKGGVGKSTIVALMARVLRDDGKKVLVIDADPDMNQASILGIPNTISITPVSELKELIAERTGTEPGTPSPFFTMNPKVDDIPETYCISHQGVKLLTMGTIKKGGGGCACPENAFLKSLLAHLIISGKEWVLLDMEAGIEHLGRGTALGVDMLVIVVEPGRTSIDTAYRIKKLADDLGLKRCGIIVNKIQSDQEKTFVRNNLASFKILGWIDISDDIRKLDTSSDSIFALTGKPVKQVKQILTSIEKNG
jgi:CO dehydrogenase maturation factor